MTEERKYQLSKSWTTDGEPIRCSASMKNLRNNTMEIVWATQGGTIGSVSLLLDDDMITDDNGDVGDGGIGSGITKSTGIGSGINPNSGIGSGINPKSGIGSGINPNSGIGSGINPKSGIGSGINPNSGIGSNIGGNQSKNSNNSNNTNSSIGVKDNNKIITTTEVQMSSIQPHNATSLIFLNHFDFNHLYENSNTKNNNTKKNDDYYYFAAGCRDGNIRIYRSNGGGHIDLVCTLEGHEKNVSSLTVLQLSSESKTVTSSRPKALLVSGSWDGTARIWHIQRNESNNNNNNNDNGIKYDCLFTLPGHENTVSVHGLPPPPLTSSPNNNNSITNKVNAILVTGSAGIAIQSTIRDHSVRKYHLTIPFCCNNQIVINNNNNPNSTMMKPIVCIANDHKGPIRDISFNNITNNVYTCSNDGTVLIRNNQTLQNVSSKSSSSPGGGKRHAPILLSIACSSKGNIIVAGSEDGTLIVWEDDDNNNNQQSPSSNSPTFIIPHPGTVWNANTLPMNSSNNNNDDDDDIVTCCHDGIIRIFTRTPSRYASSQDIQSFEKAVQESSLKTSKGPNAEELAKLTCWDNRFTQLGTSEGQVCVFRKLGRAIAAQWSTGGVGGGSWVEVGEVTGGLNNNDDDESGMINGIQYDIVLPVEIDMPGGILKKLQIGHNHGDNPFVSAQAFIDLNELDQNYLSQIADHIRARMGLDEGGNGSSSNNNNNHNNNMVVDMVTTPPVSSVPTKPKYEYIPSKSYQSFDTGADAKTLSRILSKIIELKIIRMEDDDHLALEDLSKVLRATSRYHASQIPRKAMSILARLVLDRKTVSTSNSFPLFDLLRLMVLHPDSSSIDTKMTTTTTTSVTYWNGMVRAALDRCQDVANCDGINVITDAAKIALPLCALRMIVNCFRGGESSNQAAFANIEEILKCIRYFVTSPNKNIRLTVVTILWNIAHHLYQDCDQFQAKETTPAVPPIVIPPVFSSFMLVVFHALQSGMYGNSDSESISLRLLVALGTVLLTAKHHSGNTGIDTLFKDNESMITDDCDESTTVKMTIDITLENIACFGRESAGNSKRAAQEVSLILRDAQ